MRSVTSKLTPVLALALVLAAATLAQAAQQPPIPADELVRKTVENELEAAKDPANYMFRYRKESPRSSQTKLMVETRDAMASLLIALNDQPLAPEQKAGEEARLERMLKDPNELKRKQRQEKEDADRVNRIVKAMPDAFLFEYDGSEPGRQGTGRPGEDLVRLKFRPNPRYDPPSRVEQVLTGMQGYVLLDTNRQRIAKIDGTLFKDVGFGWGILGHLDKGGQFLVDQGDVGDGIWEVTRMSLSFTGKILLFKSLNIKSSEVSSDFHRVPTELSYAQGVELLKKKHEAMLAENGRRNGNGKH